MPVNPGTYNLHTANTGIYLQSLQEGKGEQQASSLTPSPADPAHTCTRFKNRTETPDHSGKHGCGRTLPGGCPGPVATSLPLCLPPAHSAASAPLSKPTLERARLPGARRGQTPALGPIQPTGHIMVTIALCYCQVGHWDKGKTQPQPLASECSLSHRRMAWVWIQWDSNCANQAEALV